MASHVFVLVTAGDCVHCKDFKDRSYDNIVRALKSKGFKVRYVVISLARRDSAVDASRYPVNIMRHVPGFPCLMMIKGSTWDDAMTRKPSFVFQSDDVVVIDGRYDRNNPEDVAHWMKKAIDKFNGDTAGVPRSVIIPGGYQVPIIYSSVGAESDVSSGRSGTYSKGRAHGRR